MVMSNAFESFKDSIDGWADKWEKAQKAGIFKDAPKSQPHTSPSSFFGMSDVTPKKSFEAADTQYWNTVNALADKNVGSSEILREMFKPASAKELKDNTSKIAQTPNPIPSWTVGKDQEGLKGEIKPVYTDDDINELAEMKTKLQAFEERVLSADSRGKKASRVGDKIKALKQQIEDLSDALNDSKSGAPNGGK